MNLKPQNVMKLQNSNYDEIKKTQIVMKLKTLIVMELKNSIFDETQKHKF